MALTSQIPGHSLSSGSPSRMSTPTTESGMASSDSKEAILGLLHVPPHFADHTDRGLHVAYQKYKAHLEACHTYEKMLADGTWSSKKLTAVDLINLFVSKSF